MSDDIQKINTISGGQNTQNVHGNQIYIENQNNMLIHNQTNNFQNSKNETPQYFKGANIENQKNYFLSFQFDWIFEKFKNENLNLKQFLFLFFSRMILVVLSVAAFLLPLFSVNKHNISFYEFGGMIIVFVFLCSLLWSKIKKGEKL